LIVMVKCPYCGEEVSIEEYIGHVSRHGEGASWGRVSPEALKEPGVSLDKLLQDMGRGWKARDFDYFLRAGMEALVELGVRMGFKSDRKYIAEARSGVYNNLAIAILSAHKGDWEEARKFLNKAIYELGLIDIRGAPI